MTPPLPWRRTLASRFNGAAIVSGGHRSFANPSGALGAFQNDPVLGHGDPNPRTSTAILRIEDVNRRIVWGICDRGDQFCFGHLVHPRSLMGHVSEAPAEPRRGIGDDVADRHVAVCRVSESTRSLPHRRVIRMNHDEKALNGVGAIR